MEDIEKKPIQQVNTNALLKLSSAKTNKNEPHSRKGSLSSRGDNNWILGVLDSIDLTKRIEGNPIKTS